MENVRKFMMRDYERPILSTWRLWETSSANLFVFLLKARDDERHTVSLVWWSLINGRPISIRFSTWCGVYFAHSSWIAIQFGGDNKYWPKSRCNHFLREPRNMDTVLWVVTDIRPGSLIWCMFASTLLIWIYRCNCCSSFLLTLWVFMGSLH
jgi:hypothetical protein